MEGKRIIKLDLELIWGEGGHLLPTWVQKGENVGDEITK